MTSKNEERFTGKADYYKKFRPAYPKDFIDYLYTHTGFASGSVVADFGSGTGIFSRLLLERGTKVYCVEPNDDMRRTADSDLSQFNNYTSVNAPAESTTLENESVDFITAAQSFHWFNKQKFSAECRRILKSNGSAVIVWNTRDFDYEIVKKDFEVREKYCTDRQGLGEKDNPNRGGIKEFFLNSNYEYKIFRNDLQFDRDGFIGRNLSASYAPKEDSDPEKYIGLVRDLGNLFDEYSSNGIMIYPHFTEVYIGKV